MQISTDYNEFIKSTLLLVTSRQDAIGYLANGRELKQLFELHTDKPAYTDKEGRFERSGGGREYGSGSTEKDIDDITYDQFQRDLNEKVSSLSTNIDKVILFAPDQYKNSTKDSLPKNIQLKITEIISGNLIDSHPTDLLKRLQ